MTDTRYAELIARLERAKGPDREIDVAIAIAVGAQHGPFEEVDVEARSITSVEEIAPYYSESLDAAMTLARSQADVLSMVMAAHVAMPKVALYTDKPDLWPCIKAMLLAALRARAAQEGR